MSFSSKVQHIKQELQAYLSNESSAVQNSVFKADLSVAETKYSELKSIVDKINSYDRVYKLTEMPPNPALIQPTFPFMMIPQQPPVQPPKVETPKAQKKVMPDWEEDDDEEEDSPPKEAAPELVKEDLKKSETNF